MKNKLGAVLMLCGIILASSAVPLIFHNRDEALSAKDSVAVTLPQVKAKILQSAGTSAAHEPQAVTAQAEEAKTGVVIGNDEYFGILSIPSLSLELPIHSEWSEAALKTSPCRQQGDTDGSLVIAGHNYTEHFGRLDRLSTGELIKLTPANGGTVTYTVADIGTLSPTAVDDVLESDYPLTLYTCTFSGRERIVVRCNRAD